MSNDEELLQRLRDHKDIRPEDLNSNTENLKSVSEGVSYLQYELSEDQKKKKDN